MKKIIPVLCLCLGIFFGLDTYAQKSNAIGFRAGPYLGITFQHTLSDAGVLELIGTTRWEGFTFTALYEIHNPAFDVSGMQWYYGFGGHIGFYSDEYWYDNDYDYDTNMVLGVDGILGIEYFFPTVPIQLSLDWKPYINLIGYNGFQAGDAALSVRYVW